MPAQPTPVPSEVKTAEELAKTRYDPWLPVETKLVAYSLTLGVLLLLLLIWISHAFFTVR